jgi:hypothetical protein
MNKKLLFTPMLFVIILSQSCVTAKVTSNKDADYSRQPKKIFIMMNGAKQSGSFCNEFLSGLQTKFKEKAVESTTYVRDPLSLETKEDINKKISDYSPEALMVIQQKVVHSTNNFVDGGKFEISLIDSETRKTVWKSEFEVYSQFGIENAVNKSLNELFKKLTEDKII